MTTRSPAGSGVLVLLLLAAWCPMAQAQRPRVAKKKLTPPAPAAAPSDGTASKADDSTKADEADRKVDFSGNWTWTFTNPNNGFVHEPTLKIKQQGSRIAGTIYGKRGGSLPVRDVRITKDSRVAFTLDREFYGYPMEVKFIGKLEKDAIQGKMGVFVNGNSRIFDWTARRVRDGAPGDPNAPPGITQADAPRRVHVSL